MTWRQAVRTCLMYCSAQAYRFFGVTITRAARAFVTEVPSEDVSHLDVDSACNGGECFDEVLLHGLQDYLEKHA